MISLNVTHENFRKLRNLERRQKSVKFFHMSEQVTLTSEFHIAFGTFGQGGIHFWWQTWSGRLHTMKSLHMSTQVIFLRKFYKTYWTFLRKDWIRGSSEQIISKLDNWLPLKIFLREFWVELPNFLQHAQLIYCLNRLSLRKFEVPAISHRNATEFSAQEMRRKLMKKALTKEALRKWFELFSMFTCMILITSIWSKIDFS